MLQGDTVQDHRGTRSGRTEKQVESRDVESGEVLLWIECLCCPDPPAQCYIEALTHCVMVFEGGASGR